MFKIHTNMATSVEGDWHDSGVRPQNGCALASDCITERCLRMLAACGYNGWSDVREASLLNKIDLNPHVIKQNTTSSSEFKDLSVAIYF